MTMPPFLAIVHDPKDLVTLVYPVEHEDLSHLSFTEARYETT